MALSAGCLESYDPPPEITLERPESGSFSADQAVTLKFSEPIKDDSLQIRIWRPEFDEERNLLGEPLVATCGLDQPVCGDMTLAPIKEGDSITGITLTFGMDAPVFDGTTYLLEVVGGLTDESGNDVKKSTYFNFQYELPKGGTGSIPDGLYTISAYVEEPLVVPLNLVCDITSLSDGRIYFACIKALPREGVTERATPDPDLLAIAPDEAQTFTVYFTGQVSEQMDGSKTIETETVTFIVPVLSRSAAELVEGKLQLRVNIEGEKTTITGSLIHKGGYLYGNIRTATPDRRPATPAIPEGSVVTTGQNITKPEEFEGVPKVCGDQCGRAGSNGYCKLIEGFPGVGVCAN